MAKNKKSIDEQKGYTPVWFNDGAKKLYEDLKEEKLVSAPFNDFVKAAYHDAVDAVRMKAGKVILMEATQ